MNDAREMLELAEEIEQRDATIRSRNVNRRGHVQRLRQNEVSLVLAALRTASERLAAKVGEYNADYSPVSADEITHDDPELTELYANSERLTARMGERPICQSCRRSLAIQSITGTAGLCCECVPGGFALYTPTVAAGTRSALEDIARQRTTNEMCEAEVDGADFENAYDIIIGRARAALAVSSTTRGSADV